MYDGAAANVEFVPKADGTMFDVVAKRDLAGGEQLLTQYEEAYWRKFDPSVPQIHKPWEDARAASSLEKEQTSV